MKTRKNKSERTVAAICNFDKIAVKHQGLLLKSINSVDSKLFKWNNDNKVELLREPWVVFLSRIIPQTL